MQDNLSEYQDYLSQEFSAGEIANKLLLETNNVQDDEIELETSIKKLDFDIKDLNSKIDDNVRHNSKALIGEFQQIENLSNEIKLISPSINQLNNSFQRLDNEIIKPYNECIELQMALKRIHQTNKLLRFLTFTIYLINKIEEIDKSENNLSTKPFKSLYNLSILLNEFSNYSNNPSLKSIKLIRDYIQFNQILVKRCQNIIQIQIKNLLKFPIQEYITNNNTIIPSISVDIEKSLSNLLSSSICINTEKTTITLIEMIYTTSVKHSINLILRNLNNTKYLPSYINSLEKPSKLVAYLEKCLKSIKRNPSDSESNVTVWDYLTTSDVNNGTIFNQNLINIGLVDKFWREIALGVDSGVREVVNRGGPIVRNLKNIKQDLENSIEKVVSSSYAETMNPFKNEKLEYRMVLNSITNFERK